MADLLSGVCEADLEGISRWYAPDSVLPDRPTTLCHPTNEDLFAGTPVQRPLRGVYTLFQRQSIMVLPLIGDEDWVHR
jgi:hypothetical protein